MSVEQSHISDYHVHTPYCRHAQGKILDYVNAAIGAGLKELCFTDHLGRYYLSQSQKRRYWDWGMSEASLEHYYDEIVTLQETFQDQICLRIGLEVDYVEGAEELLLPILARHKFDFLLASIHCLPAFSWKHLSGYSRRDTWPVYENYFHAAQCALQSGIFDSLAHPDFIWRYVKWPEGHTAEVFSKIQQTAAVAATADKALEINANGHLWSRMYQVGGGDPFEILLESIHAHTTPITIGSDAHKPECVGKFFKEIYQYIHRKGITAYATYRQHQRTAVRIP
jgi:histidinol-phosphatase (PHP family)